MATATMLSPEHTREPRTEVRAVHVALLCDFAEEHWPSMDLVGNMLHANLREYFSDRFMATLVRPKLPFLFTKQPSMAHRLFGRFVHYPRVVRRIRGQFDLFHIVDHSYAHLAHELPADRTIVTCHDIDTFRCLLQPARSRSWAHRAAAQRVLTGLQRAAHVTCDTEATRVEMQTHKLIPSERMSVVHNGVHPMLSPEPNDDADEALAQLIGRAPGAAPELLHVGSTIPRKRIDTLLQILCLVQRTRPEIRLLRVGGGFTSEQKEFARLLGVLDSIDVLPRLDDRLLAATYRRSALLLQTSEAEGFGLPVIEAMACGTPVVASDIAALSEVGGASAIYCAVGDTEQFSNAIASLLAERELNPVSWNYRRTSCLNQSSQFSWKKYAAKMADIYEQILAK